MIRRIARSAKDETTLRKLLEQRRVTEAEQPKDYRDRVVLKPWGYEYLIFQNEHVAVWFLHIKHGHATSMHCHPQKKTCLMLLSGNALCNTFYNRNFINGLGAVVIDRGVFHSTHAYSDEGINLIEIETPPNKTDLVRLNDGYGREGSGYESTSQMQTERLERFRYFYIDEAEAAGEVCDHAGYRIAVQSFGANHEFQERFVLSERALYASCRGRLLDGEGNVLIDVGEAQSGETLKEQARGGLRIKDPLFLLKTYAI